jgi:hypothetical protein
MLSQLPAAVRFKARKKLKSRLVASGRVPRYAYRHYYIEDDGLHSRIHMQNFYSTMWPHIDESVRVRVEAFNAAGSSLGQQYHEMAPFGGLFLEMRDLFDALGSTSREGTVLLDAEPPARVLTDLTSFPLPDQEELLIGTPFWMAYYDVDENYMYVHSISPDMGTLYGVPRAMGKMLIEGAAEQAGPWRAGRLLDARNLADLEIVLVNHSAGARKPTVGLYDADDDATVWSAASSLQPHEVKRFRVPDVELDAFRARKPSGRFRVGVEPMPTSNGKPYLLMRCGDGPLSLHHG